MAGGDPLLYNGPASQQDLFNKFSMLASGYPVDAAMGAAVNILINAVRQTFPLRTQAEDQWKSLMGQGMNILLSHYDPTTNRRRSTISFPQVLRAPQIVLDPDKSH